MRILLRKMMTCLLRQRTVSKICLPRKSRFFQPRWIASSTTPLVHTTATYASPCWSSSRSPTQCKDLQLLSCMVIRLKIQKSMRTLTIISDMISLIWMTKTLATLRETLSPFSMLSWCSSQERHLIWWIGKRFSSGLVSDGAYALTWPVSSQHLINFTSWGL